MGGLLRRLLGLGRASGPRPSGQLRRRPEVDALEDRRLLAISKLMVTATPKILSPPNGRYVPVTVSGSFVESSGATTPQGFFNVTDQYRRIEPFGGVALHNTPSAPTLYTFSFTIHLRAQRGSQTYNGRQYDILVGAKDKDGTVGKTIFVNVPKDAVHPLGPPATRTARAVHPHATHRHH